MRLRQDNGLDDFVEKIKLQGGFAGWNQNRYDENKFYIFIILGKLSASMTVTYHDTYYNVDYFDSKKQDGNRDLEYMLHDCLVY